MFVLVTFKDNNTVSSSQSKTELPSGSLTVLRMIALHTTPWMAHTDSSIDLGISAISPSGTKSDRKLSHSVLLNQAPNHTHPQFFATGT